MTEKTLYYKAVRPDGTSFYDARTKWRVGRLVRHPAPNLDAGLCSKGVLHVSDAPGETLVGGDWPCRLFLVEPRGRLISDGSHKHGCAVVKVIEELPAWQAFGPNGEAVVALIERAKRLTPEEIDKVSAAWNAAGNAARDAAWVAAMDAACYAARDAARYAARDAARYAAGAAAGDAAGDAARYAAGDAARYAASDRSQVRSRERSHCTRCV